MIDSPEYRSRLSHILEIRDQDPITYEDELFVQWLLEKYNNPFQKLADNDSLKVKARLSELVKEQAIYDMCDADSELIIELRQRFNAYLLNYKQTAEKRPEGIIFHGRGPDSRYDVNKVLDKLEDAFCEVSGMQQGGCENQADYDATRTRIRQTINDIAVALGEPDLIKRKKIKL